MFSVFSHDRKTRFIDLIKKRSFNIICYSLWKILDTIAPVRYSAKFGNQPDTQYYCPRFVIGPIKLTRNFGKIWASVHTGKNNFKLQGLFFKEINNFVHFIKNKNHPLSDRNKSRHANY